MQITIIMKEKKRCVILRHDIDQSLDCAVKLAEVEAKEGAVSTWFVLLRTDFYNVASRNSLASLHEIQKMGHEIGLHFDEVGYGRKLSQDEVIQNIVTEAEILSSILGSHVKTVSTHRPSRDTLDANHEIPGIVNSYGKTFFRDFKYLSDSRRNWREPVLDIVQAGEYERLHILTHAFWYREVNQKGLGETVRAFVNQGNASRYAAMRNNIQDLELIMKECEVL